jgi:hypothetical protein
MKIETSARGRETGLRRKISSPAGLASSRIAANVAKVAVPFLASVG